MNLPFSPLLLLWRALRNHAFVDIDLHFPERLLVSLQESPQCHPESFGSEVVHDQTLRDFDRGRLCSGGLWVQTEIEDQLFG